MGGSSIALVGILFLIAYEFSHAGDLSSAREWIRTAHLATASAIFFAFTIIGGLLHESFEKNDKIKKLSKWFTIGAFILGWALMFAVLGTIYQATL
jgi:RsiW-degrading membrane proteinase PrsW (M82 family)